MQTLQGIAVSPGVVIGEALILDNEGFRIPRRFVVRDAVDDELPKEVERLLEQNSLASKLGAATGAIFNRPSSIKDMWSLKEQAIKASDRLARFLVRTLGQLP